MCIALRAQYLSAPDFLETTTAPLNREVSSSYMLPGSRLNTQLAESPLKKGHGFALSRVLNASQLLVLFSSCFLANDETP